MLRLRGGGREKRKPKKDVGGTSRRVIDDNDPMDCDYEVEEREMGRWRKAPPRQLPKPSPSGSEDDDSDDDEKGMVVVVRMRRRGWNTTQDWWYPLSTCQARPPEGRSGMRTSSNPITMLVISSILASKLPPLARVSILGFNMISFGAGSSKIQCAQTRSGLIGIL